MGSKMLEILMLPGAFFCCFFPAAMARATALAAPPSPALIQKKGLIKRGVVGAIVIELDLACSGMLLGEKVNIQSCFFWVSAKSGGGEMGKNQFPPASSRTMRILVPGKK
jgi:hypothetical protein